MSQAKFSRNAAITSQVIITVWLAVQLLAGIFQKSIIELLCRLEDIPKINSWAVIVLCVGSLCVISANLMICRKRGKNAPLLLSSIAAGLLPIAVQLSQIAQLNTLNNKSDINKFVVAVVYNSDVVKPLSYLLYAGAAVTIAAAAVYAFGDSETFPRKASIASQTVFIVWTVLQLLSSIFQRNVILKICNLRESILDESGKITSYPAMALCFGGLLILAANVLICRKKGRLSPLLITSITTALLPIIAGLVMRIQNILAGFESVYVVGDYYNSIVITLSYLLYVSAVLAIAAAAVHLFADSNKNVPNENAVSCIIEKGYDQ